MVITNDSTEAQQYTVQYEKTDGKLYVETFNLGTKQEKTIKDVKVDTWKLIKVAPVSS